MTELNKRLGSMDYDGLIADIYPKLVVSGGTIRKLAEAATIKRGTILAKSSGTSGAGHRGHWRRGADCQLHPV